MRLSVPSLALLAALVALVAPRGASAQDDDEPGVQAALVLGVSAAGEADAGGTPIGSVEQGRLRRGQRRRFPVAIPAGGCVLVVAQARGVEQLRVSLTQGRRTLTKAESEGVGAAQALHCNEGEAVRGHLEVRSLRGSGPFAAGAYRVAADALAPPGPTAHAALEALEQRHAPEGYVAASPVSTATLTPGEVEVARVALVGGACYRVLGAGSPTVRGLSLELRDPRGQVTVRRENAGGTATLGVLRPLCPTVTGRYELRVGASAGGEVVWQLVRAVAVERAAAEAASRPRPPIGGSGTGFLSRALRTRHGQVGEGMRSLTPATQATLQRSGTEVVEFEARAGRCYRAIAVGMPSIRTLRIRILDAFGSERAASGTEAQPSARFCPTSGGRYRAELKATLGYGGTMMQIFESRGR